MQNKSVNSKPSHAMPLRIHLSALIMGLLLGIALPLIWIGYQRGEKDAAVAAAERMQILADRAADRYRAVFGDALSAVSLAAISDTGSAARLPTIWASRASSSIRSLPVPNILKAPSQAIPMALSFRPSDLCTTNPGRMPSARRRAHLWRCGSSPERPKPSARRNGAFSDRRGRTISELAPVSAAFDPRERAWYHMALAADGPVIYGPRVMAMSGRLGFAIAQRHRNDPTAVVGTDILLDTIRDFLLSEKVSGNAKAYVFDSTGGLVIHSDETPAELALLERGKHSEFRTRAAPAPDPIGGLAQTGGRAGRRR